MAWIKLYSEIWESWKIPTLCAALGVCEAQAVGHLVSLWSFTERNAWKDGDLTRWGVLGVARAAKWQGTPEDIVRAFRAAEFLDQERLIVHEWTVHQAGMIHNRTRNSPNEAGKIPTKSPHTAGKIPPESPRNPEPDKSREDKSREETTLSDKSDGFLEFWKAYPKKVGKGAAMKSWKNRKPPLAKCLATLSWQVKSIQWLKADPVTGEKGAFIPLPTTWINQGRWDDIREGFDEVACSVCGAIGTLPKGTQGKPMCRACKEKEAVHGT